MISSSQATLLLSFSNLLLSLNSTFFPKNLGQLEYFFGIEFKHLLDKSLLLTENKYIKDLFHETNMATTHPISSLLSSTYKCESEKRVGESSCKET